MGLFDCVASPEGGEHIDESQRPISRPKELSRSDHDISRRRALPLFASQTSLKNIRDIDFWRQRVVRFLYTPEGRDDIRVLKVPFDRLEYVTITDFITAIPPETYQGFEIPPEKGIFKDYKVFWERDGIAEAGIFKWHGVIEDVTCFGLQLDRKKAVPFGTNDGKGLFYCKPGHRALVPANEVMTYKKFLRQYLGLPPKKDSLVGMYGSVRLPAKAIQARNSKAGDRVYLHKEKKFATVQWIGKIGDETVIDLVYERSPLEDGKPVSPDEPYISRSVSLADFIGELDSEPNSPISPGNGPQALKKAVTTTVEVESHAELSSCTKTEGTPLQSPRAHSHTDEQENSDMEHTSEDEDSESESDDEIESDSETASDDSAEEMEETNNAPQSSLLKTYPGMENVATSAVDTTHDDRLSPTLVKGESVHQSEVQTPTKVEKETTSRVDDDVFDNSDMAETTEAAETPKLLSPKRKGFFKFSPKPRKRAKSKSAIEKEAEIETESKLVEKVEPPEKPQPSPRSKSPNIFGNFKFGISTKKKKKSEIKISDSVENIEIMHENEETKRTPKFEKRKSTEPNKTEEAKPISKFEKKKNAGKGGWGGLFKSRSKSSLQQLVIEEPSSPTECTTPLDEMIPPDKIPTPPPNQSSTNNEYCERKIERPEFLNLPSTTTNQQILDRSFVQSPLSLPNNPADSVKEEASITEQIRVPKESEVEVPSDEEETDKTDDATNMPPPVPKNPPPQESDLEEQVFLTESEVIQSPPQKVESVTNEGVLGEDEDESGDDINTEDSAEETEEINVEIKKVPPANTAPPVTAKDYLERFKESKVRNRPSSFGSFLARIKNQKKMPDEALQAPSYITSPSSPTPEPNALESDVDSHVTSNLPTTNDVIGTPEAVLSNEAKQPEEQTSRVSREIEGDQEGITLDLLDVQEPTTPSNMTTSVERVETPKRKSRTFSFTFVKPKRKPSNSASLSNKDLHATTQEELNNENVDPNSTNIDADKHQLLEDSEKSKKQSKPSSFRNSFKRTFSLTRKKQSIPDSCDETPISPSANIITKPRPVTLYVDNNDTVPKQRNSFRNKRPASIHVDVQPWDRRHGRDGVDLYSSPSSDEIPISPTRSPNPALLPKQENVDIPKHRIFTTPAFFYKKNKRIEETIVVSPNTPKSPAPDENAPQCSWSNNEEECQPISLTGSGGTASPPPLPTAPPPMSRVKRQPSVVVTEDSANSGSPSTKLKSALKQRKEIDYIPNGLKVSDRVLWYSGNGPPTPGTVQRLFKDGTDKYTAMVKFDREISAEPLRLVREGDAYMITVEELITQDMFGAGSQSADTPNGSETPLTPSVRFDGLSPEDVQMEELEDSDDEHDLPPPFQEEEVSSACGFKRGIQCQDKSCCLETILFSLFYTTNAFDISMLYGNSRDEDFVTANTRRILRKEIVDPLRRKGVCDFHAVKKLRDAVKPLSDEWQTLSTDAEVMMFILFDRALKLGKFITYSDSSSDFLHQLVVDTKDLSKSSTVQHLFETSLHLMENIKLQTIPTPALILEMPRSNDKLMQYKAVIPNLSLHVSHLINNGPRLCICGMVAKYECTQCSSNAGKNSIVYCDNCKATGDVIHFQLTHETQLSPLNQHVVILDLSAIICLKAGHYFSFVKCGNHKLSPWVYFDGAEIENPKVCIEQNLGMWLDRLEKYPGKYQDALQYPLLTHILQDSHICIYQPREKSSSV